MRKQAANINQIRHIDECSRNDAREQREERGVTPAGQAFNLRFLDVTIEAGVKKTNLAVKRKSCTTQKHSK